MKKFLSISLLFLAIASVSAQSYIHEQSTGYEWPDDPAVVSHLKAWQDLKFGIILHWGVYSVPGICESWTITSEDWITPDTTRTYEEYKQWYWGLSRDFNPTRFDPAQWARVAREAGMKYVVFTTKHHDGFCLFDSHQTDYTVTHSGFAGDPRADVARYVFDAFRAEGMMTGCYFSKPDWHSPYYWWPARATSNRLHNYPISQYPERWQKYRSFVYNQVEELMTGYGPIDILWFDGGWCTAPREDIGLDSIVDMARAHQPGLIVVERACPGKHENYQTPEQKIPDGQINTPWESCITLTHDWGWTDHPVFKSPATVLAMLAEIVAKGGSLLLGVGPTPEGLIEDGAVERLQQIGRWLNRNGDAIYGTVTTPIYRNAEGNVWFTAAKDNPQAVNAIIVRSDDRTPLPEYVEWEGNTPRKGSKVRLIDTKKALRYEVTPEGHTRVFLPAALRTADALALRIQL